MRCARCWWRALAGLAAWTSSSWLGRMHAVQWVLCVAKCSIMCHLVHIAACAAAFESGAAHGAVRSQLIGCASSGAHCCLRSAGHHELSQTQWLTRSLLPCAVLQYHHIAARQHCAFLAPACASLHLPPFTTCAGRTTLSSTHTGTISTTAPPTSTHPAPC
jgi:hypothetical protein